VTLPRRLGAAVLAAVALTACGGGSGPAAPSAQAPFSFDVAVRAAEPASLVVVYGESSTCPRTGVDADVRESADEVVVTLTSDPPDPGPCTADHASRDVTLRLDAPLADRRVVDGATGTEIAVATGTPPGPASSPVPLPTP
jgi:hypothetical protein